MIQLKRDISNALLRSAIVYEPYLSYFKEVHYENTVDLEMNNFNVNNKELERGKNILKSKLVSGFDFFFGFVEKGSIMLLASKIGVLAAVVIKDNEEDIESKVYEIINKFHKSDRFIFVYTIVILATDNEKFFINNFDEKMFSTVSDIIKGKYNESNFLDILQHIVQHIVFNSIINFVCIQQYHNTCYSK